MAEFDLKVHGLPQVERALFAFSDKLGKRVVISSMREGAKVIQKSARAKAPKDTGRLRKGIIVRNSKIHNGRRSRFIGVYVGLRKASKRSKLAGRKDPNDAFYGAFVETGWNVRGKMPFHFQRSEIVERFGSRTGRKTLPGKRDVPGAWFMRNAYLSRRQTAARVAIEAAKRGALIVARRTGLR